MNLYEVLADNSSFVQAATAESAKYEDSFDTDSSPDSEPAWIPPSFEEVAADLGCHDCEACYRGWCRAVSSRGFYNIRLLRDCPKS
ncbi:hypothetical protein Desti_0996 [Desulfomonile tiedjei DSM 6799]|uniref:Uncharacterized protein n=1 Tax=Desulfomonile tiedjei (strain ATCC 49306 / DSM 6799 / DCB-1) TaxID=706587 RepID=I4C2C3_DESTA|nr:hypothetical protein Desti_0996 [Desulfomonile tiedjei DSM 6799]